MKRGYLSEHFDGVAAKRLSAVEADFSRSNQHEFNGVEQLKSILGEPSERLHLRSDFLYLEDERDPIRDFGELTWYDARRKAREERGVMRWEWRLYFSANAVLQAAGEGDVLIVARRRDGQMLTIIARSGSTVAHQMLWLFGLDDVEGGGFVVRRDLESERDRLVLASQLVLESIGIEFSVPSISFLDQMRARFGDAFPTTRKFSDFARETLPEVSPIEDVDAAIMAWMEREEALFREFERFQISDRLAAGFGDNVDEFISYSLSVQNRRKSRVGYALENHLEVVFEALGLRFSRGVITENRSKPDFLFPGGMEYHDPAFDPGKLTMLGVKTTCKDRWRQVLSEAARIPEKHLLTLEVAISESQTAEMRASQVQLVVPRGLHSTYTEQQRRWLLSLGDFSALVGRRAAG